jgi:hypothetical protein
VDQGSIDEGNTYRNATLGMTIILPGHATITDKFSTLNSATPKTTSDCRGPLCGHPSIYVAIESPILENPSYAIVLAAYKLPPEYQDSKKHPLKNFANIMIIRSLDKSWVPESGLIPMRLGGRPAFKFLAHTRKMASAKGLMYVSKSNGYVFMLVATTLSALEELRSAVENMQLGK